MSSTTIQILNTTILFANQFPGSTLGAQIAAACASLSGSPGTVVITGSGTISSSVTIPSGVDLAGAFFDVLVTISGTGSIVLSGVTSVKNLTLVNTTTTTASIVGTSVSEFTIENVVFQGGKYGISLTGCSDYKIINVSFNTTPVTGGSFIRLSGSGPGQIINPRIEAMTLVTGGASGARLIYVESCNAVSITNPQFWNIDRTHVGGGGISFTASSFCSLTGGIISGCNGIDGVLTENGSSYIFISNVVSINNSSSAGAGTHYTNGDGFDIFNSSHVYLTNCLAQNDGTYANNLNQAYEIFNSYDVVCTGCVANNNGLNGFQILGSPSTKLIGCTANYNGNNGANLQSGYGTVTTNGTMVTYVSGSGTGGFGSNWEYGTVININGTNYNIASITSNTILTLTTSAGIQSSPVPYTVPSRNCQVTSCYFEGNGQSGAGGSFQNGIGIAGTGTNDASGGVFTGNICTDPQASQTQLFGVYIGTGSLGRGIFLFNKLEGNNSGTILDGPGTSPQLYDVAGTAQWVSKGVINSQNSIYGAQMVLTDITPVVAAGQIGFGTSTATTASTTTGGATLPAKAAGYLEINIAGTVRKMPYYAN